MTATAENVMAPSPAGLTALLPFFQAQEWQEVLPYLTQRSVAADEVLMRDGAPADFMGFLLAGRLAVKRETAFPGKYILVAVIEPGGIVGELAAVEKGRRNATVVAMEECRLLLLSSDAVTRLLAEQNALGVTLLKRIIHVQGHRLRRASERLSWIL